MSTLLIVGGFAPERLPISAKSYDKVIAADSGYDTALKFSIVPDYVVGDFDSTSYSQYLIESGYEKKPKDKDETDTELALQKVVGEYDILGGGEGRLDHILSILSLFPRYGYPRYWFTRSDTLITVKGRKKLYFPISTELSIFTLFKAYVTTSGLVWNLKDRLLDQGFLSQSNRIGEENATIYSTSEVFVRVDPDSFFPCCISDLA